MKKTLVHIAWRMLLALALVSGLSACAEVKPWQRGTLAKEEMQWQPDSIHANLHNHIYFSKEASTGGASTGGGGCGCN